MVWTGLSAVFFGGIVNCALIDGRGGKAEMSDLFIGFREGGVQMAIVAVIAAIAVTIGSYLCYIPGFILGGLLMTALPFVVDRKLTAMDGLKAAWNLLQPHLLMAALMYFVMSLIAGLGVCACGIGIIFTYPLMYIIPSLIYLDLTYEPQAAAAPSPYASAYPETPSPMSPYPTSPGVVETPYESPAESESLPMTEEPMAPSDPPAPQDPPLPPDPPAERPL